jgi:hypothetical protein
MVSLGLMKLRSNPLGELCWKCKESEDYTPKDLEAFPSLFHLFYAKIEENY